MEKEIILDALKRINYPGFSRDIVSFGLVRSLELVEGQVHLSLAITTADKSVPEKLRAEIDSVLKSLGRINANIDIAVSAPKTPAAPGTLPQAKPVAGIRYVVAVAGGKGGVGKSTFAVNLACALERELAGTGKPGAVGLLDCDIYGPTVPLMMGLQERPELDGDKIVPPENHGVRVMSLGFFIDESAPVIWRGPMITKTIQQFLNDVAWGETEILVVDLPPGTGDVQLSLIQNIPLTGALIVTTPQRAAASVAQRCANMFLNEKIDVPVLGVVENMSFLETAGGERQAIFGEGGGEATAELLDADFLGKVPLDPAIRESGDSGVPIVTGRPDSTAAGVFREIARRIIKKVASA